MTERFEAQDERAREVIRQCLDETLFVEAGAGTGKTTSLVDRIRNLVAFGVTTLDRIAAITFTEAAAAELRDRVKQRLEESVADDSIDERERRNCQRGMEDLDRASIQTIHSFAAEMLRERPIEANLPPSFEIMDEIEAQLEFEEAWSVWLDSALSGEAHLPTLSLALALQLSALGDSIRSLSTSLCPLNCVAMANALFDR